MKNKIYISIALRLDDILERFQTLLILEFYFLLCFFFSFFCRLHGFMWCHIQNVIIVFAYFTYLYIKFRKERRYFNIAWKLLDRSSYNLMVQVWLVAVKYKFLVLVILTFVGLIFNAKGKSDYITPSRRVFLAKFLMFYHRFLKTENCALFNRENAQI